ncbi:MAG: MCE family protein [Candidatus Omnitrophica bacterium]|nr:MCE family protein [Candidatus Omnitrophota bacterium]
MAEKSRLMMWSDFRVGIVTFFAIGIILSGVIFAGGDKGLLFQETALLKALLTDVGGLKSGAGVTMGGMTIGKVDAINFSPVGMDNRIEVTMEIRTDCLERIKKDSVPSVRTQGMLGDRYVDISMGTPEAPLHPLHEPLIGKGSTDFDETLTRTSAVLEETQAVLSAINNKEGSIGQLFYDPKLYEEMTLLVTKLNELIQDFRDNPKKYVKLEIF